MPGAASDSTRSSGTSRSTRCLAAAPHGARALQAVGIAASSVNDAKFVETGLTLCSQRGVPFHGVNSVWERLDVIVEVIESAPRAMTYAYESRLDHTGHGKGCESREWREMLTTIDRRSPI